MGCNGAWQVGTQDFKRVTTCGVFHACQQQAVKKFIQHEYPHKSLDGTTHHPSQKGGEGLLVRRVSSEIHIPDVGIDIDRPTSELIELHRDRQASGACHTLSPARGPSSRPAPVPPCPLLLPSLSKYGFLPGQ